MAWVELFSSISTAPLVSIEVFLVSSNSELGSSGFELLDRKVGVSPPCTCDLEFDFG